MLSNCTWECHHLVNPLVLLSVGVMDGFGDLLALVIYALCLGILVLRLLHLRHFIVGECRFGGIELAGVGLAGVVGGAFVSLQCYFGLCIPWFSSTSWRY